MWLAEDGSSLVAQNIGAAVTRDGHLDLSAAQHFTGLSRDELPPGTFDVPALGDHPETLMAQWRALIPPEVLHDEGERAYLLMNEVRALATFRVLHPEGVSALWTTLAQEPGVRSLGHVTDRLGRDCVAIASTPFEWQSRTWVDVLLVDPETGHLVGTEEVMLFSETQDVHEPTVTAYRVITAMQMVSAVEATP